MGEVFGALLGGVGLGAFIGILGWCARRVGIPGEAVLVTGLLVSLAILSPALSLLLPERRSQVDPAQFFRWSARRAAFLWGLQLGFGIRSYIVTPALYSLLAVGLVIQSRLIATVVVAVYGVSRGIAILALSLLLDRRLQNQRSSPRKVLRLRIKEWSRIPLFVGTLMTLGWAMWTLQ